MKTKSGRATRKITDERSQASTVWFTILLCACAGLFLANPLYGHSARGGGHSGAGHASSGHVGGGHVSGGGHIGTGGGHVGSLGVVHGGGGRPAYSSAPSHTGGFHQGDVSHRSVVHGPNTFSTRAPSAVHSTSGGAGQHFDAGHWTSGHATVPQSSGSFVTRGGNSPWSPVGTTARGHHSAFADAGHHFDASQRTGGHFGDVHHFRLFHHDDHHAILGHHDFHHDHHFFFGGLAFSGWSYPYYGYYPHYDGCPYYYDYPYPYYAPSYYEAPVYSPTNYQIQAANTSAATEARFPDVAMPRMELPGSKAPEALPDKANPESPQP